MSLSKKIAKFSKIALTSVILVSLSSCTLKITEEQMTQLQELRKQERSFQDGISNKKAELNKINDEINLRKSELKDCENERDLIKQRLSKWPDIWPDYTPNK